MCSFGGRGTWVWCAVGAGLCWRGDDGTLIVETDEAGRLSSHKPPGTPQELAITLDRSISAVVYAGEVLEISARVHNKGTGRAYWLRLVPVEDTTADIAARPWVFDAPTLSILEPGGNETLTARVHLHTSPSTPLASGRYFVWACARPMVASLIYRRWRWRRYRPCSTCWKRAS